MLSACNSPFGRYWRQNFSQFFTNEDERLDDFLNGKERKYIFYRFLSANMVFYFGNLRIDKSIQGEYISSELGDHVNIIIVGQNHCCSGVFIINQLIKTLQEYKKVRFLNSIVFRICETTLAVFIGFISNNSIFFTKNSIELGQLFGEFYEKTSIGSRRV